MYLEDGIEELRNAVILQACKEYRVAYKNKNKHWMAQLEDFFYSYQFADLTCGKISPDYIIKGIKDTVDETDREIKHKRVTPKRGNYKKREKNNE